MNSTVLKSILNLAALACTAGATALGPLTTYGAVCAAAAGLFVTLQHVVSGKATDAKIADAVKP